MPVKPIYDEKILLRQLAGSDEHAFYALYEHYYAGVLQFVLKFVKSRLLAEDLTQEVFLKIWEHREKLSDIAAFKGYLFIVARNHTLSSLKKAFRFQEALGVILDDYTRLRSDTEEELLQKEYMLFLQKKLESLSPRTREIFIQCRQQGRTYEEVAVAMGISRNAVKNHMVSAMKMLRLAADKELGMSL